MYGTALAVLISKMYGIAKVSITVGIYPTKLYHAEDASEDVSKSPPLL